MYRIICITFGLVVAASGCARTGLVARDAIVASGRNVNLVADVHEQSLAIFCKGLQREPVRFFVGDREVGSDETDETGLAQIDFTTVGSNTTYVARSEKGGQPVEATGTVFVWDPNKTAIAIDMDETICASEYLNLIWGDGLGFPATHGSAAAVRALAQDYHIIYWSARPRYMIERTRKWLDKNGFPPGPILFTDDNWGCFKQAEVKKKLLAELRQKWPNVRIGIGDKYVDVQACNPNGMLPVIVNPWMPKYEENAIVVRDWKALAKFFAEHRDVLSNLPELVASIEQNKPLDRALPETSTRAQERIASAAARD